MVAAREKALRLARAAQEREAVLLNLAEEYFLLTDEADAVRESAKSKGDALVEAAKVKAAQLATDAEAEVRALQEKAPLVVGRMLETGAARADVASRLDLSVSTVRKIDIERGDSGGEASSGQPEAVAAPEPLSPVRDGSEVEHSWDETTGDVRTHEPVPVG